MQQVQLAGPAGLIASYFCNGYRTKKPTTENKAEESCWGLLHVAQHPKPLLRGLPLLQHRSFLFLEERKKPLIFFPGAYADPNRQQLKYMSF